VTIWNAYVRPTGSDSLDSIFTQAKLPRELDLLSIDIDGDDYWLFHHLEQFSPRVILVEFNPTIPIDVEAVQRPGAYFGASAKSLLALAHRKNYKLAHVTACNLVLVRADEFSKLGFEEPSL